MRRVSVSPCAQNKSREHMRSKSRSLDAPTFIDGFFEKDRHHPSSQIVPIGNPALDHKPLLSDLLETKDKFATRRPTHDIVHLLDTVVINVSRLEIGVDKCEDHFDHLT